jgi:hypothetical protein
MIPAASASAISVMKLTFALFKGTYYMLLLISLMMIRFPPPAVCCCCRNHKLCAVEEGDWRLLAMVVQIGGRTTSYHRRLWGAFLYFRCSKVKNSPAISLSLSLSLSIGNRNKETLRFSPLKTSSSLNARRSAACKEGTIDYNFLSSEVWRDVFILSFLASESLLTDFATWHWIQCVTLKCRVARSSSLGIVLHWHLMAVAIAPCMWPQLMAGLTLSYCTLSDLNRWM